MKFTTPGKQNDIADGLSRIPQPINFNEQEVNFNWEGEDEEEESSSDAETAHSAESDNEELIKMIEKSLIRSLS